jgi:small neutral amino acid transporter SnatA (MarC family)
MLFSSGLMKVLGRTGINVMERIVGIVICCLALQFIINAVVSIVKSVKIA